MGLTPLLFEVSTHRRLHEMAQNCQSARGERPVRHGEDLEPAGEALREGARHEQRGRSKDDHPKREGVGSVFIP